MLINSRAVALLLAVSVAAITTAFLSLVEGVSTSALVIVFCLSFAACFILTFITLEFLIFREVKNLYQAIDKINRQDFKAATEILDDYEPSANPLKRANQQILAYASQKQSEIEELKKMEAFRREFIADVSHELKTPLFAAQGFVLTLLDGAIDDENVRYKFLKKAARSLDGLSMLVQDLLTLTQIESGQITMQFEDFDIRQLTEHVFEQLEEKAAKRAIELQIENPVGEAFWVHADYNRIGQVMTNLINNAIKYGNEGGHVRVSFMADASLVQVTVADDGPGIPREHQRRIFERFYRIEKSRSRKQGGSGLGLAIVKHILEKHGTDINLHSEVGVGTTFTFRLPKADATTE
ncbi:sensor histidine kinase [Rhodoflexus caldus]|uniref:sensor histidine kinase n=1 Tax=Rhodoflexus caldus TaxID=2891236 RepID=UPI00202AC228|nr:ATP-binding protein [Rhodoflexus caldus]